MFIDDYFKVFKSQLKDMLPPKNFEEMFNLERKMLEQYVATDPVFAREQLGARYNYDNNTLELNSAMSTSGLLLWWRESKKIYKIANEFGKKLSEVSMDFKVKDLKDKNLHAIIEFPTDLILKNEAGNRIKSGVVMVNDEGFVLLFPEYNDDKFLGSSDYYFFKWDRPDVIDIENKTFQEIFSSDHKSSWVGDTKVEIVAYILKCIMYILCSNPDLSEYKPLPTEGCLSRRERDRNIQLNIQNGRLPVTLVGFNWKQPKHYHVGEIFVPGHLKWQRHGVGLALIKLIWRDDYSYETKNQEIFSDKGDKHGEIK